MYINFSHRILKVIERKVQQLQSHSTQTCVYSCRIYVHVRLCCVTSWQLTGLFAVWRLLPPQFGLLTFISWSMVETTSEINLYDLWSLFVTVLWEQTEKKKW